MASHPIFIRCRHLPPWAQMTAPAQSPEGHRLCAEGGHSSFHAGVPGHRAAVGPRSERARATGKVSTSERDSPLPQWEPRGGCSQRGQRIQTQEEQAKSTLVSTPPAQVTSPPMGAVGGTPHGGPRAKTHRGTSKSFKVSSPQGGEVSPPWGTAGDPDRGDQG